MIPTVKLLLLFDDVVSKIKTIGVSNKHVEYSNLKTGIYNIKMIFKNRQIPKKKC